VKVNKAEITPTGLKYDREFMFVDTKNKFVSQRTVPQMALIKTRIDALRNMLHLEAPGVEPFEVSLEAGTISGGDVVDADVWGDVCRVRERV
jgi:uncharacterized protein YcbX